MSPPTCTSAATILYIFIEFQSRAYPLQGNAPAGPLRGAAPSALPQPAATDGGAFVSELDTGSARVQETFLPGKGIWLCLVIWPFSAPLGAAPLAQQTVRCQQWAAPATTTPDGTGAELAFPKPRYKLPGQAESTLVTQALTAPSGQPEPSGRLRFAAAVAAFGQYLRGGAALNGFALVDIITLANGAKGEDASGYRADFIGLARQAQALPGA